MIQRLHLLKHLHQIQVRPEQRKPNIKKQEKGMAGTAQMDIRYIVTRDGGKGDFSSALLVRFRATADQQQPPALASGGEHQQPAKPQIFGVPLQVENRPH